MTTPCILNVLLLRHPHKVQQFTKYTNWIGISTSCRGSRDLLSVMMVRAWLFGSMWFYIPLIRNTPEPTPTNVILFSILLCIFQMMTHAHTKRDRNCRYPLVIFLKYSSSTIAKTRSVCFMMSGCPIDKLSMCCTGGQKRAFIQSAAFLLLCSYLSPGFISMHQVLQLYSASTLTFIILIIYTTPYRDTLFNPTRILEL